MNKILNQQLVKENLNLTFDIPVCMYLDINSNGFVTLNALCYNKFNSDLIPVQKMIPFNNFYIDNSFFDVIVADPIKKAVYYLYNVYYVEDSTIYVVGITSKIAFDSSSAKSIKGLMSTHFIFNWYFNSDKLEFHYDINSLLALKFNSNYFSQIYSFENLEKTKEEFKIYYQLIEYVNPYDRPINYIQRSFFIQGALLVKKYNLTFEHYKLLYKYLMASKYKSIVECYFSFEQFYLTGMMAALNSKGFNLV